MGPSRKSAAFSLSFTKKAAAYWGQGEGKIMRLSAKAQYACVAMVELACSQGEKNPVHLKNIAENHGISQRFLVQILLQLKGAGLVDSTRGAMGGYLLAKAPSKISLADIINAIDQAPPPLPSALSGLHATPAVQAVKRVLQDIQRKEQERLEEITLEDLAKQTHPAGELSYQI
jgi:Rrf2 family protein